MHTFDALSYVLSVERKPWTEVFHPHHLAYGPLGVLAQALGRWLGYMHGAALPMQVVNALAGAAGVALFFVIVRRVTQRSDLAWMSALLLGSSYAYWYYAVEIEVYTVAVLFLLLCLWLVIAQFSHPQRRNLIALGAAEGGAILFHQTNLLLCVPLLVLLVWDVRQERAWRRRLLDWGAYAVTLGLVVALPYLFVMLGVSHFRSLDEVQAWLLEYARTGWWGGPITAQKWELLGKGLAETIAQPGGALLGLLLVGLGVAHLRNWARWPWLVILLLVWLLTYGGFFLWWEPDNIEFWIASLPAGLLLLALALQSTRPWSPSVWLGLAIGVTMLGQNYDSITRRGDAATDLQRTIATALGEQSSTADLLLVPDGLQELYLPYYEARENFLSLNQAMFDHAEDWPQACGAVQQRIEQARQAGATALIADEVLHPPPLLLERFHLSQAQIDSCFSAYRAELLPLPMPASAPAYWRLPTATELADGAGWQFGATPLGWQASNVEQAHFADGWQMTPLTDPSLLSPLLNLDATRFTALEIRLAAATAARDAQVFFAGPDGQIDEARSLRWTLSPGTEAQTYRLELSQAAGWEGIITRLRIDPVGVGDGNALRIEWIRLIKDGE